LAQVDVKTWLKLIGNVAQKWKKQVKPPKTWRFDEKNP
jgi:hypothetical protein